MKSIPKHRQLRDWLVTQIESGVYPYGSRLPSENDLAARFGISRQTVRQAIGALEADGFVNRVRGSGTFVADLKSAPRQATRNIGVITTYLDEYIFPSLILGIESVLSRENYTMSLGVTHNRTDNESRTLTNLNLTGFDGLIVEGTKSAMDNPNAPFYENLIQQGIPVVFVNGYYQRLNPMFVTMDDSAAGELACNALIQYGHKRIGAIFKSDDMQGRERYLGYCNALKKAEIDIDEEAVLWYTTEEIGKLFGGNMDTAVLKRLRGCTAVVCYNDQIAVRFAALLKRRGLRVSKDISISSFDNSPLAKKSVYNLTSVVYPGQQIGAMAAEMLLKYLQTGKVQGGVKIPPAIKLRGSIKNLSNHKAKEG